MSTSSLADLLHQLELAAAAAGRALQDLDEAAGDEVLKAWAPVPITKKWVEHQRRWLLDAAEAWPDHEADDQPDLHRLLIEWCRRRPRRRRRRT